MTVRKPEKKPPMPRVLKLIAYLDDGQVLSCHLGKEPHFQGEPPTFEEIKDTIDSMAGTYTGLTWMGTRP